MGMSISMRTSVELICDEVSDLVTVLRGEYPRGEEVERFVKSAGTYRIHEYGCGLREDDVSVVRVRQILRLQYHAIEVRGGLGGRNQAWPRRASGANVPQA